MWRHVTISVLGLLVAVTPWALGFSRNSAYVTLALGLGVLILAGGLAGWSGRTRWLSRPARRAAVAVFGVIAAATPWLAHLPQHTARVMITVVAGLIVVVLAASESQKPSASPDMPHRTRARAS